MTSKRQYNLYPNRSLQKESHITNLKSRRRVTFSSSVCHSENNITIRKQENQEVAQNWTLSMHKNAAKMSEVEISIPLSLHKSLTESKESLIGSIIEECGKVNFHFPSNKQGPQKVIIGGPEENVEKAKKKLLQLAQEEQQRAKSYSVAVPVQSKYHQFLMSKNGGNLHKICERTGAHIIFPTFKKKDQESITIIGTEEAVKDVKRKVEVLLKDLKDVVEDSILINPKFHNYFVMQRGQLLRELINEYGGVFITFSYTGNQSTKVTIKGAKACVEAAKKHIQELFEPLGSRVTTRYVFPRKLNPFIMGPICSQIQHIAKDCKVQIKLPDTEKPARKIHTGVQETGKAKGVKNTNNPASISPKKSDSMYISSKAENCKATQPLESLIPVTAEVHVPFHLHHYIIGHKGSGLRKLIREFEVHIQVSQPGGKFHIISIMGLEANVEQAKKKLQNQVKALQMELDGQTLKNCRQTFSLDPKYHSKIFGNKGIFISQICSKYNVIVRIPKKGNNPIQDQITICGSKDNILGARDAIMKMLRKIEKPVSKEIPLNHKVCANITGFGGKSIHKIMKQFQVDIRFPSKGDCNNSSIIVSGSSCNVQEAIDYILSLEKHFLSVGKCEPPVHHQKHGSLNNTASRTFKDFGKRNLCNAKSTTYSVHVDSSQDFPKLKHQMLPKPHPWRP
ncbi:vigilin-like [Meriones unguiculatus]|uniref:vigilin-like n=1 Tax=Meriones unguiculatus TaxID=10047 RepID=UPI00293F3D8E|nr:vigilin-like [Meriones unguiculatus]